MYSKVSSYQVKRWLDKQWNEQEELEKYITKLNIDWSKGWLMIDDYTKNKPLSDYLFKSRNGVNKPITRVMTYMIINEACKKCGIQDNIGTHTLRKTFGYHHYQNFHDVAILQYLLNHSSPSITLRYICISQDNVEETLQNFEL